MLVCRGTLADAQSGGPDHADGAVIAVADAAGRAVVAAQPAWRRRAAAGLGTLAQGLLGFRVEGLVLRPIWDGRPRLQQVRAELVQLVWQPAAQLPASAPDEAWSLPALEDLAAPLGWLPGELQVDRLLVQLPCDE